MNKFIIFVIIFIVFIKGNKCKPYDINYSNKYCMAIEKNNNILCFCVNSCRNYTVDNFNYVKCPVYKINPDCVLTYQYEYAKYCLCQYNNILPSCSRSTSSILFLD
ncbi:hypothetical protein mvtv_1 [Megavirus vitis transpoviron]|uniref:Uncharacterized protein n=1 Tax=Megavirus vitis transpoviron TaxID=2711275 RepID=A0A2P1EHG2_9VIRU|nr:hypothetical protein mvtv_1 [Megavirus vitis transpoviron]